MNHFRASDLEIVGFNGAPLVECGRSFPVARRKADGMHAVLRVSANGSLPSWHGVEEANEFAATGRWTRLQKPLELPRSGSENPEGSPDRQPMVVYAARGFFDAAGLTGWPTWFRDEAFEWRPLDTDRDSIRAACGFADTVECLMGEWANALIRRFDDDFRHGFNRASLKRVADFALCAARSRPLRWKAYTRLAIAQEPDTVRPTFDRFIRHEFPGATWDDLLNAIRALGDVLKAVPAPAAPLVMGKLSKITNRPALNLRFGETG